MGKMETMGKEAEEAGRPLGRSSSVTKPLWGEVRADGRDYVTGYA